MGRSRAAPHSADDDPTQRSKRKRSSTSGENLENVSAGQGTSEGKKPLYHCNYCNKDITGKIRIKCTKCPDFDLCVECFSVGAEITPHKSNHPYRVMDNLSFPLICPDWFADEEILLLEAIEMYGLGNWTEVAEHVGTKSKDQCIEHYTNIYLNSPCFPLPDMSHVVGKNRKELLAMAKGQGDGRKGFPVTGETQSREDSPFSPSRVKTEDGSREVSIGRSPSSLVADGDSMESKIGGIQAVGASKKSSSLASIKDASKRIKIEDSQGNRSIGETKPKYSGDEGPSLMESSGYNPKRQEFDPEYDNDAEQLLAEMEFKETDSETERELKIRVLHIYASRLDERKRRKDFILERNLLYPNPLEKELSEEERAIYNRFRVFMRFQTQEEHDSLIRALIEEHRLRKRIQELQECRAAGCRTRAEADAYIAQKKKREAEANAQKVKESTPVGGSKVLQKSNRTIKGESPASPCGITDDNRTRGATGNNGKDSASTAKSLDDWDVTGLPGADLLNETEWQLCCENRLLPTQYLKMQETLVTEILKGTIHQKSDAYGLLKVDPCNIDKIYDIVRKKMDLSEEQQPA